MSLKRLISDFVEPPQNNTGLQYATDQLLGNLHLCDSTSHPDGYFLRYTQ